MSKTANGSKPTPEDLETLDSYVKIEDLDHNEMVPFILSNLKNQNLITASFKHSTMILIGIVLFAWIGRWDTSAFFIGLGASILFTFTIGVLLHELLHLLVYKILGARKTKLKLLLDQAAVAAVADHFVVSEKEFYWLAFTPFVVLTTAGLIALFMTYGWIFYGVSFFLIIHATACIGDFSLAGFMYEHREDKIYTFDDVENDRSFFYKKTPDKFAEAVPSEGEL
ncbi:hypothetical protein BH23BAC3_BH23BAC3_14300 [soil metagenome]